MKIISSNNSTILPLLLITLPVARRGFFFFLFLYFARVAFYSRRTRGSRCGVLLMPSKKSVLDGSDESRFGCVRYIIFDTFNTFEMSRYIMDS